MTAAERSLPEAAEERPGHPRRWWVLTTMTVCLLVVITGNTTLNVAIPTLQRELGASQAQLQWAIDAYVLVFAGLLFSWGVVGDRIGRRRVLLIGLSVFTAGSLLGPSVRPSRSAAVGTTGPRPRWPTGPWTRSSPRCT